MFFVRLLVVVVVVLVVVLAVQSAYGRVISQPGGHIRPGLSPGSLAAVQNCEITYQVNCASETCSSVASVADISVILLEDLNPRLNCSVPFIDIGEILCIQNSIKTLLSTPSVTFRTPRYFSGKSNQILESRRLFQCHHFPCCWAPDGTIQFTLTNYRPS
jgi:hypothetical protein